MPSCARSVRFNMSGLILAFVFIVVLDSNVHCGPLPSTGLSIVPWFEDAIESEIVSGTKKRDGVEEAYLEQCGIVKDWKEDPGLVKVLAFLDPSRYSSHRQATMLKVLRERLERSGIGGVSFLVVSMAESENVANETREDTNDEERAWASVPPPAEDLGMPENEQEAVDALVQEIGPDIRLVKDTAQLKIWEKLHASRDQVLVIDRCGRLSYQVIVPWSILHFPYVKAAILSTYKDQPCGECKELGKLTRVYQEEKNSTMDKLTEEMPMRLNITQMKEIAAKKYNLEPSETKAKKPHATSQDIPDDIIRLLNDSVRAESATSRNDTEQSALLSPTFSKVEDPDSLDLPVKKNHTETRVSNEEMKSPQTNRSSTLNDQETEKNVSNEYAREKFNYTGPGKDLNELKDSKGQETAMKDNDQGPREEESSYEEPDHVKRPTGSDDKTQQNSSNYTSPQEKSSYENSETYVKEPLRWSQQEDEENDGRENSQAEKSSREKFLDHVKQTIGSNDYENEKSSTNKQDSQDVKSQNNTSDEQETSENFSYEDISDYLDQSNTSDDERQFMKSAERATSSENAEKDKGINDTELTSREMLGNFIDRNVQSSSSDENSQEPSQNADYVMPIRIIMRAPHVHEYRSVKKRHEYLVLNTGNPQFHGHLDSGRELWPEEMNTLTNTESSEHSNETCDQNVTRHESTEDRTVHSGVGIADDQEESAPFDGVYGKDESPGFYGEDAEYWRNYDHKEPEINVQKVPSVDDSESTMVDTISNVKDSTQGTSEMLQPPSMTSGGENSAERDPATTKEEETSKANVINVESTSILDDAYSDTELIGVDEESEVESIMDDDVHNNLILHYSKLLPWIYYILED